MPPKDEPIALEQLRRSPVANLSAACVDVNDIRTGVPAPMCRTFQLTAIGPLPNMAADDIPFERS